MIQLSWYHPIAVSTAWALLIVAIERRWPANPGQRLFREGFVLDLFWYTIFEGAVLGFVIGLLITRIDAHTGWSRLHVVSDWPIWAQLGFFWVTHDLYI